MKIGLLSVLIVAGTTLFVEECSQLDMMNAKRNGAAFDVTLRVVDDMGALVEGSRCDSREWRGVTGASRKARCADVARCDPEIAGIGHEDNLESEICGIISA